MVQTKVMPQFVDDDTMQNTEWIGSNSPAPGTAVQLCHAAPATMPVSPVPIIRHDQQAVSVKIDILVRVGRLPCGRGLGYPGGRGALVAIATNITVVNKVWTIDFLNTITVRIPWNGQTSSTPSPSVSRGMVKVVNDAL